MRSESHHSGPKAPRLSDARVKGLVRPTAPEAGGLGPLTRVERPKPMQGKEGGFITLLPDASRARVRCPEGRSPFGLSGATENNPQRIFVYSCSEVCQKFIHSVIDNCYIGRIIPTFTLFLMGNAHCCTPGIQRPLFT